MIKVIFLCEIILVLIINELCWEKLVIWVLKYFLSNLVKIVISVNIEIKRSCLLKLEKLIFNFILIKNIGINIVYFKVLILWYIFFLIFVWLIVILVKKVLMIELRFIRFVM